jgi:hypothetical protein
MCFLTLNILIPGNIYSQFRTAFLSVETSIQIDKINKNLSNCSLEIKKLLTPVSYDPFSNIPKGNKKIKN